MYLSVGLPIYNESKAIGNCLHFLMKTIDSFEYHLYFCFNGCTDDSESEVEKWLSENPSVEYTILKTEKGKTIAQKAIINRIIEDGKGKCPILFLDADVYLEADCAQNLYYELFRIKKLLAVGALTVPESTLRKTLAFYILNIRNLYPLSEISIHNIEDYKWYVRKFPQKDILPQNELRNRIYFHGRCFMLKYAEIFLMPDDNRVSDDTFIPNMLHFRYGPGVIRNIFSAKVHYKAYESFRQHWLTYWLIYNDKKYLYLKYPEFYQIREKEKTTLNKTYIRTLPFKIRLFFFLYRIIVDIEQISYKILPVRDARELWNYREK